MGRYALNMEKYADLARTASAEGCVLLKNDNSTLPLKKGDKVKVELRFRGRELGHKDIGKEVMLKFIDIVKEFGEPTKAPAFEGNNMVVMIDPKK